MTASPSTYQASSAAHQLDAPSSARSGGMMGARMPDSHPDDAPRRTQRSAFLAHANSMPLPRDLRYQACHIQAARLARAFHQEEEDLSRALRMRNPPLSYYQRESEADFRAELSDTSREASPSGEGERKGGTSMFKLSRGATRDERWRAKMREQSERLTACGHTHHSDWHPQMGIQAEVLVHPDMSTRAEGRGAKEQPDQISVSVLSPGMHGANVNPAYPPPGHPYQRASPHIRNSADLYNGGASTNSIHSDNAELNYHTGPGLGHQDHRFLPLVPPLCRLYPGAQVAARLRAEQESAIVAVRTRYRADMRGREKKEQKAAEERNRAGDNDPARRRSVQLQVFVHARPTYCRWEGCRAILNSWSLLEKHIKHVHMNKLPTISEILTSELDKPHGPRGGQIPMECHWAGCTESFVDKEKLYRHCLMEHMEEFCARCPFSESKSLTSIRRLGGCGEMGESWSSLTRADCLFEGPSFPSLMAHIGRRHPDSSTDNFVPRLEHFAPPSFSPPKLPEIARMAATDASTEAVLASIVTPSITPFVESINTKVKRTILRGCCSKYAEDRLGKGQRSEKRKEAFNKRVAGGVIAEVIRLAMAEAGKKSESRADQEGRGDDVECARGSRVQTAITFTSKAVIAEAEIQGNTDGIPKVEVETQYDSESEHTVEPEPLDIKAIVKRVKARLKPGNTSSHSLFNRSPRYTPNTDPTALPSLPSGRCDRRTASPVQPETSQALLPPRQAIKETISDVNATWKSFRGVSIPSNQEATDQEVERQVIVEPARKKARSGLEPLFWKYDVDVVSDMVQHASGRIPVNDVLCFDGIYAGGVDQRDKEGSPQLDRLGAEFSDGSSMTTCFVTESGSDREPDRNSAMSSAYKITLRIPAPPQQPHEIRGTVFPGHETTEILGIPSRLRLRLKSARGSAA